MEGDIHAFLMLKKLVDKIEKVVGIDIDGDGTIGGEGSDLNAFFTFCLQIF